MPQIFDVIADDSLRCPACQATLRQGSAAFHCVDPSCRRDYPIVNGVPILIDDTQSLFSVSDFLVTEEPAAHGRDLRRFLPARGIDGRSAENYALLRAQLKQASDQPLVLVVGGQVVGNGMDDLVRDPTIRFVETDVTIGPRTRIVCDGHNLPFADGLFDGVVIQAVLEHVVDPARCVAEIHRVLKPNGLVYAETPFMQQVHGAAFDFTRFTALGHRRLFRMFDEVASGACGGPGSAFVWSYEYLLNSLPRSRRGRRITTVIARLTSSWIKYLDLLVLDRPAALDAASGLFFMGTRAEQPISDRDLITQYRGGQRSSADYPVLA